MRQSAYLAHIRDVLAQRDEALRWLHRSYRICGRIGVKPDYTEDEFDAFEALTSRFARTSDILLQQVYRSIDAVELEDQGVMLDRLNRAEKRGLIQSVDEARSIRELRNSIAHEYIREQLVTLFHDVLAWTPRLIVLIEMAQHSCHRYETPPLPRNAQAEKG